MARHPRNVHWVIRTLAAVFVGGVTGTGARLAVDALLPTDPGAVPWSTLIVNVSGSLVLGVLVAVLWPRIGVTLRAGLGAGVLGSFTTFSAIAVTVLNLPPLTALLYLLGSLLLGFIAAVAGLQLGARMSRPRHPA